MDAHGFLGLGCRVKGKREGLHTSELILSTFEQERDVTFQSYFNFW